MSTGLEPEEVVAARENVHALGERPRDLPGRVCPRCGQRYTELEVHRSHGREYLYAVHDTWVNGKRFRHRCYLGPKDGYKYGAAAQFERPWFGALLPAAKPRLEFQRRLGYLENLTRAALGAAETPEDTNEVIRVLAEGLRAAAQQAQIIRAAAAPDPAAAGGEK